MAAVSVVPAVQPEVPLESLEVMQLLKVWNRTAAQVVEAQVTAQAQVHQVELAKKMQEARRVLALVQAAVVARRSSDQVEMVVRTVWLAELHSQRHTVQAQADQDLAQLQLELPVQKDF